MRFAFVERRCAGPVNLVVRLPRAITTDRPSITSPGTASVDVVSNPQLGTSHERRHPLSVGQWAWQPMAISPGRTPEINVTPLIDVLLVLLIIFMVVAPSRPGQLEAKVPQRPKLHLTTPPASDKLVVTVAGDHTVTLNGTRLSTDDLGDALAAILIDREDKAVIVRAPTGLAYQDVIGVVDRLKGAGAGPIGLQVDFLET